MKKIPWLTVSQESKKKILLLTVSQGLKKKIPPSKDSQVSTPTIRLLNVVEETEKGEEEE